MKKWMNRKKCRALCLVLIMMSACSSTQEGAGDNIEPAEVACPARTVDSQGIPKGAGPDPDVHPPLKEIAAPTPSVLCDPPQLPESIPIMPGNAGLRRGEEGPEPASRSRRDHESEPWVMPMAPTTHDFPDFGLEQGSVSVGTVVEGFLVRGRQIPGTGPHHAVLAEHQTRATSWGTDELVSAVLQAAETVGREFPDAVLGIGNLARQGGGPLPWSISHQAGRDIDIGFYLVDPQGKGVVPDTLYQLKPGNGELDYLGRILTFSPERNLLFIKALLDDPTVRVQYIFCADFLIKKMLATPQARKMGAGWRARIVKILRQPRGTLPHDDHFHIRIACDELDLAQGCRDIEQGSVVNPERSPNYRKSASAAMKLLTSRDEQEQIRGCRMAAVLKHGAAIRPLEKMLLGGGSRTLRLAALQALGELWKRVPGKLLAEVIAATDDPEILALALAQVYRTGASGAGLISALLKDERELEFGLFPGDRLILRARGARLAGWSGDARFARQLLPLLQDSNREVGIQANRALELITNNQILKAGEDVAQVSAQDLSDRWKSWLAHHGRDQEKWILAGFDGAGLALGKRLNLRTARRLANMIPRPEDRLSLNAQRMLAKACPGRGPEQGLSNKWWIRRKWNGVLKSCFR